MINTPDMSMNPTTPDVGVEAQPFVFGTKAENLIRLSERLQLPRICDPLLLDVSHWQTEPAAIIDTVLKRFADSKLVVRSSARAEDTMESSMAGAFTSVVNVEPVAERISAAINDVVASYNGASDGDQVLIQKMVEDVAISGVVLTRELDNGGPYYVINYDDYSGRTDTVTGGAESKTVLIHRSRPNAIHSARFRLLIDVVKEIEWVTGSEHLDIEFCITSHDEIFVFQVRPLVAKDGWTGVDDAAFDEAASGIRRLIRQCMLRDDAVSGSTTILSEMSDWNPAEMIGNAPKPLALSLYRHLITDSTWSKARAIMGYRPIVDKPLLIALEGRPYIDVRLSLNSLLPDQLPDSLAERLIEWQIQKLADKPEHHDKIEFEIAISCRDFSYPQQADRLRSAGFAESEIAQFGQELWKLTNSIFESGSVGVDLLLAETGKMSARNEVSSTAQPKAQIKSLLSDCIAYGTLPFSQLARHGFIAASLLRSLVERGAMTPDDLESFMQGIETVAGQIVLDIHNVSLGNLDRDEFLRRYGHLRPGTYDITSWRYDERPDMYLGGRPQPVASTIPFTISCEIEANVAELLAEQNYDITPKQMFAYIAASVKAREASKFEFTRNVSDTLAILASWGESIGLSREDVSFLTIDQILSDGDLVSLKNSVAMARERRILTRALRLPHLIAEPDDTDVVRLPLGQPSFITSASVTGPVKRLAPQDAPEISGHIVFIECADPGFDWIFSHDILGLVTKFGGANSHMSIRAAEFGLPAAIGCGERLFETLARGSVIELNCSARVARLIGG